jgi:hypothetical protein
VLIIKQVTLQQWPTIEFGNTELKACSESILSYHKYHGGAVRQQTRWTFCSWVYDTSIFSLVGIRIFEAWKQIIIHCRRIQSALLTSENLASHSNERCDVTVTSTRAQRANRSAPPKRDVFFSDHCSQRQLFSHSNMYCIVSRNSFRVVHVRFICFNLVCEHGVRL